MKVTELQQELRRRGLSTQGLKPELEQRLAAAQNVPRTMEEIDDLIAQCKAKGEVLQEELLATNAETQEAISLRESVVDNFISAAEQGNVPECVRFLDVIHLDVHAQNSHLDTALSIAVATDQLEMVSFLHKRGAFTGATDSLMDGASSRAMIKALQSCGVKPSSRTLHRAIRFKKYAVVDYLVRKEIVPQEDALVQAVQYLRGSKCRKVMRLMLAHHALVDPPMGT
jgi:hypothetical protein